MRTKIQQVSDTAVRLQFGSTIDHALTYILLDFVNRLELNCIVGITSWEIAYTTVTVHFEPWRISGSDAILFLRQLGQGMPNPAAAVQGGTLEIPVCYGGEHGPDLADVADYHGISQTQVIDEHTSAVYPVAFIGFAPGFPYLFGLPAALATPRLSTPRQRVPAGSVGIGGPQTGIYPNDSPAGWRIIGRTPLKLFDYTREPSALCAAGDTVRFVPITAEEFEANTHEDRS